MLRALSFLAFGLTRFPRANRHPSTEQIRGHASLENAMVGALGAKTR
jgi:hypothetical protein